MTRLFRTSRHPTGAARSVALTAVSSVLILNTVACTGETDPESTDVVASLAAPGPYTAGYFETEMSRTPQIGTDGKPRVNRLAVWYPTDATPEDDFRYQGLFPSSGVAPNAPLADVDDMPVLIYSHGHQGYAEASGFLATHLASRGWLVVSADHTGNTTLDGPDRTTEIFFLRPLDVSAVLDLLETTDDPVLSRAGTPVLAAGHSFGGYTLNATSGAGYDVESCTTDPEQSFCSTMNEDYEALFGQGFLESRIDAVILMAAGNFSLFGSAGAAQVTTPTLMMTGALDERVSNATDGDPLWEAIANPGNVRVDLQHGGHMTFSDFSGTLDDGEGLVAPEEGWRITNVYATAWALAVQDDDFGASVLDGTIEVSDQVTVWAP